jgi:hypothetical protein
MPFSALARSLAAFAAFGACAGAQAAESPACQAQSPAHLVPVIELYTSEGCSSCPPADRWLSTLKPAVARGQAVVQAFHVGYWDYIGWVDRFASPAHTQRQKEVAAFNRLGNIYTPQLVRNGRDSRDYGRAPAVAEPARARIAVQQVMPGAFEATVTPADGVGAWAAYWTVTESGHSSKVKAGENAGETLKHDFVVRQYVQAGEYRGAAPLKLRAIAGEPGRERHVNLVVFEPRTGRPLQALSLACG